MRTRQKRLTAYLAAAVLLFTSWVPTDVSAAEPEENTQEITVTYGQTEARKMHQMINDFRTGDETWVWSEDDTTKITYKNLGTLQYDPALEEVAMQRAAEIAVYYSHTRPNGNDCYTAYPSGYSAMGENIAWGQTSAEQVFIAWREDDKNYAGQGHRRNMLSSDFNAVGIGHVTYNGIDYWTQEFGYRTGSDILIPEEPFDGTKTVSIKMSADPQTVSKMSLNGLSTIYYSNDNVPDILQGFASMLSSVEITTDKDMSYTLNAEWKYDSASNSLKLKDGSYTLPSNISDTNGVLAAGIKLQRIDNSWDTENRPVKSRTIHEGETLSIPLDPVYYSNYITAYSWYKLENGVLSQIPGATGDTLEISGVSAADAGSYVAIYMVYSAMCITPTKTVAFHECSITPGVEATCIQSGLTEGRYCSICQKVIQAQTKIPPTGQHTEEIIPAVAASCTKQGLTEGKKCSVCGEILTEQKVIPATGHQWNDGEVTEPATCTQAGTKLFTCTVCGDTKTETIPATGKHTSVTDPAVAPTCTKAGLTEGSHCSVCGEIFTKQESIPATGHKWNDGVVTKEATCAETGVKLFTCTVCGDTKTETLPTTDEHTPVTDSEIKPTCTTDGLTKGSHCSVCGKVLTKQESIPATGHKWNDGVVTKEATCAETGVKLFTCTVCGDTKTETLPTTDEHTPVTDSEVEPTCTTDGLTKGSHCSVCGKVLTKQESIPATGHRWDDGVVAKEATCGEPGTKLFTCTVCGDTKTESIPATGNHTSVTDPAVAPTCTKAGLTEGSHCSVCQTTLKEQQVIEPLGHDWNDGEVTSEASCTEAGAMLYTCNRCKATRTVAIDPAGHTPEVIPGKPATCKETGLSDGSKCSVCGVILEEQTVLPVLTEHSWNQGTVTKEATCTEDGEMLYTCTVCGKTKTAAIDSSGHKPEVIPGKPATCKETGLTDGSKCSVCGAILEEQTILPVLTEHSWNEGTMTKEATCTENGEMLYTCTICGTTKTVSVEPSGHTPEVIPGKAATCKETGLTDGSKCSVCGEILENQAVLPVLTEHSWNDGTTTKAATCTDNGEVLYTCTVCGTTKTDTLAAVGHTVIIDPAKEPTYTEEGLTEGSHCSVCGQVLKEQTKISKLEAPLDTTKITDENKTKNETSSGDKEKTSTTVNTGDETQWIPTAVLFLASLSVVVGSITVELRRKRSKWNR
mgnify:CR=1 FL=1